MATNSEYQGGENFDLHQILLRNRKMNLKQRIEFFNAYQNEVIEKNEFHQFRMMLSKVGREVEIFDRQTRMPKKMLMFGSNNYLGLADNQYIIEKTKKIIDQFGVGIGGPPILNGYTVLHHELEERIAALKNTESALIFSSGYGANVGLVSGLINQNDSVICDSYSHASFTDGLKMCGISPIRFQHNSMESLKNKLQTVSKRMNGCGDIYVGVEGVYSMDGDIAPLPEILDLCKKYNAILILDDAHGTGTMGETGRGTAEHFGLDGQIDITMGTFSKSFSLNGGFVAGSTELINYLRFFARSYMFSASMPPVMVASILAAMDVIEEQPELVKQLRENSRYAVQKLNEAGFDIKTETPIIPLITPDWMNIRIAAQMFHAKGIFLNSIEYPAVPKNQERFRISIMANHTKEDIDFLVEAIQEVWREYSMEIELPKVA